MGQLFLLGYNAQKTDFASKLLYLATNAQSVIRFEDRIDF